MLCEQPAAELHTAPLRAELGARTETAIQLSFNAPVAPGTISNSSVSLRKAGVAVAGVSARADGSGVTLDLAGPLDPGTTYEIVLQPSITDGYGLPLPAAQTLSFTTSPQVADR